MIRCNLTYRCSRWFPRHRLVARCLGLLLVVRAKVVHFRATALLSTPACHHSHIFLSPTPPSVIPAFLSLFLRHPVNATYLFKQSFTHFLSLSLQHTVLLFNPALISTASVSSARFFYVPCLIIYISELSPSPLRGLSCLLIFFLTQGQIVHVSLKVSVLTSSLVVFASSAHHFLSHVLLHMCLSWTEWAPSVSVAGVSPKKYVYRAI